jgi:hypothetical protein
MKKYLIGLFMGVTVLTAMAFQTQKKPEAKKKIVHKGKAFLYNGMGSGKISKRMFDSLLNYNLIARDTQNREHPVTQFSFTYAERGVYEDSTGKPQIMTDYYSAESDKGRLPDFWRNSIKERTKQGDTAMFYEIISNYGDSAGTRFYAEPLKLIITD